MEESFTDSDSSEFSYNTSSCMRVLPYCWSTKHSATSEEDEVPYEVNFLYNNVKNYSVLCRNFH